jgi:hypothetical protein
VTTYLFANFSFMRKNKMSFMSEPFKDERCFPMMILRCENYL